MRIFAKIKDFFKKILIVITMIISISVIAPKPVEASIGGQLMKPICEFIVFVGDGIIDVVHGVILKQDLTLIRIDTKNGWLRILKIGAAIIAFSLVTAASFLMGGGIGWVVGAVYGGVLAANILTTAIVPVGENGLAAGKVMGSEWWDDEVDLPLYSITPETIFRNGEEFPILDVNFFNPREKAIEKKFANKERRGFLAYDYSELTKYCKENNISTDAIKPPGGTVSGSEEKVKVNEVDGAKYTVTFFGDPETYDGKEYMWSFSGPGIDDTITQPTDLPEENKEYIYPISYQISEFIARAYYVLLTISTVAMMSILVYIGIRIVLASTSPQKAKYKQLFADWIIGMALLFSMHFIMVFLNDFVAEINKLLNSVGVGEYVALIPDKDNKIEEELSKKNIVEGQFYATEVIDGVKYIKWPTNYSGMVRIQLQNYSTGDADKYFGFTLMFLAIIFYTVFFVWIYLKRIIYLAFLTLIAPLVAVTYPIDKVNDGSAQGFNYWFKEYVFNLLLQPLHLLIYTLMISAVFEMAAKNWLYSLVVLGFMATAEKIIRKMFNFQKAETPGLISGAAGTGLTLSAMRWLSGRGSKGGKQDTKKNNTPNRITTAKSLEPTAESLKAFQQKDIEKVADEKNMPKGIKGSPESENTPGMPLPKSEAEEGGIENKTLEKPGNSDNKDFANKEATEENTNEMQLQGEEEKGFPSSSETQRYEDNSRHKVEGDIEGEQSEDSTKRGFWGSIAEAGSTYIDGQGRKLKEVREDIAQNGMKKLTKKTTGAIVGATLGTVGLAAGIASGDLKNVTTLGAAGVAAGYKVGSEKAGSAINKLTVEEAGEAYKKARLGQKEYAERESAKYKKELANSEETISTIQEKFGCTRKEAKQRAQEMVNEYVDAKVTDVSEMVKIEKFRNQMGKVENNVGEPRELTRIEASQIAKMVSVYNMQQKDGSKDRDNIIERMQKNMDINKPTAVKFEAMAREYMKYRDK